VTDLILIYESVTSSASVAFWLKPHSWTLKFWIFLRLNDWFLERIFWRMNSRIGVRVTLRLAVCRQSICLGEKPVETHDRIILFSNWTLAVIQLLLALASAVTLRSKSRRTHDHILPSQTRDSPNLEGQVTVFLSPRKRVARFYPRHWVLTALESSMRPPFITSRQTEYGSPSQTVRLLLSFIRCYETCVNSVATLWFLQAYSLPRIRPLTSRCLAMVYSDFQSSCHNAVTSYYTH
jgi:hypothetical protein